MARPFTETESTVLKKQFLELLETHMTVADVCEKIKINRSTIYYWRGTDPKFRDEFIRRDWETVSQAENTLKRLMEKDDLGAACFILKTRGRQFGYLMSSESHEHIEIKEIKPTETDEEIIARYKKKGSDAK